MIDIEIPTHWTRRKPSGGLFVLWGCRLSIEPADKRTIVFFDGQNLFHADRATFGYTFPNYDPIALSNAICKQRGWNLAEGAVCRGMRLSQMNRLGKPKRTS
jgi:hypothetical protein